MRSLGIKLGLAFLLGGAVTFGLISHFKGLELDRMAQEVYALERKNSALQERVRMLQLSLEKIEEEVIIEQTPKKPNDITRYWNDAYRLSKQSRKLQCTDLEQGRSSSLHGILIPSGSGAVCSD